MQNHRTDVAVEPGKHVLARDDATDPAYDLPYALARTGGLFSPLVCTSGALRSLAVQAGLNEGLNRAKRMITETRSRKGTEQTA